MRVLLIEDDSATAQSIELMLKSESFNVYTTDLGEEGVDLGKLYDYDIILLDLDRAAHLPFNRLPLHLAGAETGQSVTAAIVAGEVMMENGRLTRIDEGAILEEIRGIWDRYSDLRDQANSETAGLVTAYTQAANRAQAEHLGFSRHVTGKMGNY